MYKIYLFIFLLVAGVTTGESQTTKPVKILGAGLGAAAQTPYNLTSGKSLTLYKDTLYILTGFYFVDSLAEINIQAGTVIQGDSATQAALIIKRGGKIFAQGTSSQPIVFTSAKPVGKRKRGDWAGIIILGSAPTNKPATQFVEGVSVGGQYGGSNSADNSGVIKYVRIEYPGIVISANNEVNGLTMGGVGSGTTIEYVQVSYSNDDSFEWFGGTVNAKYLVAYGGTDDDFDTDYGFNGKVQFGFGKRDSTIWDAAGQSNGFESDNEGSSPYLATPLTSPVFCNMTVVGPQPDTTKGLMIGNKFEYGAVIRRNSRMSILNSVIVGYPFGISLRDSVTALAATDGISKIRNVSLQSKTNVLNLNSGAGSSTAALFNFVNYFTTTGWNNNGSTPREHSSIGGSWNPFATPIPNPIPSSTSELVTLVNTLPSGSPSELVQTTYRGAFDPTLSRSAQWDNGWTNYSPQTTNYSVTSVDEKFVNPIAYKLEQNFPNPFNPSTTISYTIPFSGITVVKVFDILGKEVATLVNENQSAGSYKINFSAKNLSSGIYFYSLKSGSFTQVKKLTLMK